MSFFTEKQIREAVREANREQRKTYNKACRILLIRKIKSLMFDVPEEIIKRIKEKLINKMKGR